MKRLNIVLLILLLSMTVFAQEVSKTGTTAAKFLSIPVGSRAQALGGAYTSMADDATSIYWNPAGLAHVKANELFFMHSDWLADINFDYAAMALNAGSLGTIGVSVTAMTMGEMIVTTEDQPEGTGEIFSASSFAVGFSLGRRITDRFIIGGSFKIINEKIWNSSATGVALDIGTQFVTPFYGIRLGTSISNFGTKMRMSGDDLIVRKDIDLSTFGNNEDVNAILDTDAFDLPLNMRIGISRDFNMSENNRVTLAVDAFYPNDNQQSVNVGGEYAILDGMLAIRGGYRSLFQDDSEEGWVVGGGLRYKLIGQTEMQLDYTFQSFERLKNVHQYSIALRF